jgi:hypothetical protein
MPIRDKVRFRLAIPAEFADIMREVAAKIEAGDAATTIESDDLLQWEDRCCGGLLDAEQGLFGFVYFPSADQDDQPGSITVVVYFKHH